MAEPYAATISSQSFPRLRAGLSVIPEEGETIVFSPRLESMESIDDPDGVWAALLGACDGTVGIDAVVSRLARAGFDLSRRDVAEGIEELMAQGLLVDGSADVDDEWSNQRSYIEQLTRGDMDVAAAQGRVRSTRVLVLGAGGTGSWLALSLAMMGVAELIVVDPDVVEDRNRTRQPYASASVGRRKVEVLGEIVTGLRPSLSYAGVDLRVEHEDDLSSLAHDIDVVACCADEPSLDVDRIARRARLRAGRGAPHHLRLPRGDRARRALLVSATPRASVSRLPLPLHRRRARTRERRPEATQAANACQRLATATRRGGGGERDPPLSSGRPACHGRQAVLPRLAHPG